MPFFHTGIQVIKANFRVTGPNLTKFLHNVGESTALLTHPLMFRYANLFWNASMTNEGLYANFASKMAAMAISLE